LQDRKSKRLWGGGYAGILDEKSPKFTNEEMTKTDIYSINNNNGMVSAAFINL
jgi:hypothetical protein